MNRGERGDRQVSWTSRVKLGLVVLLSLCLARLAIDQGLGGALASRDPARAARLGLDSDQVLTALAEKAVRRGEFPLAAKMAQAALDHSPLNVSALRTRAQAMQGLGRTAEARRLMAFAGERGWRDNQVQAWLLDVDLQRRDYRSAFRRADALARRRQAFRPAVFALGGLAAADPVATEAFVERLAARPPWRAQFFEVLAQTPQTDEAIEHLLTRVEQGPAPLTQAELSGWIERLTLEGRYGAAQAALSLFRAGRATREQVRTGAFTSAPGLSPFAWTKAGLSGADIEIAGAPGRNGLAAWVGYDGFAGGDVVRRLVTVTPGGYRLVGEVYPENGAIDRLRWQVRCAPEGPVLVERPMSGPAATWSRFEASVQVPGVGCDAVWLTLVGDPQGRRSAISAWFGPVVLRPGT